MKWPNNKDFAFTIIDDTDGATVSNISSVYSFLTKNDFKITKTVWVYPSRNNFTGQTLQMDDYYIFLSNLEKQGFEIQLHNVGSGKFRRTEIIEGLNIFKEKFGNILKCT